MAKILFVQNEPRSVKKVGPIREKRGDTIEQAAAGAPAELLKGRPDLIVVDLPDAAAVVDGLKKAGFKNPLVVVAADPKAVSAPGVLATPPGQLSATIDKALAEGAAAGAAEGGEERIIKEKTAKTLELKARGVDPFPHRFGKKNWISEISHVGAPLANEQHSGEKLTTAGRVMQLRLMGKAAFFHVQDASGKAQAYIRLDAVGEEQFNLFKDSVQIGDFVGLEGEVFKTKTGEPTLSVGKLTLLAKALRPLPEKWHGLKDTEERYRSRHLDLISNAEVRELFAKRSKIVDSVRSTFKRLGYMEVETPILLSSAGGASATPFKTHHNALKADMVLRIATELYLKRLIIGGMERVYEIGRIFRNEGIDTRHNPEFTMLEAYAAYSDYHGMAELFEAVIGDAAKAIGVDSIDYRGEKISLTPPFRRLYMPELWKEKCGEDIHKILKGKGFDREALMALAKRLHIEAGPDTPSAKVFERIFDEKLLPELVQPAFVLDHPTAITPLAKCKPGDESLVERFEFFVGGVEMSNAYTELNDPLDQRGRLEEQMRQRTQEKNEEADLLDEDFVRAMEAGMPPTGGIGIGIDRLCMVLTGNPSIREVILFPTLKPE